MQRLILISGFGGSGKSTCAQLLWNKLENVALVEADHLFRIKPFEISTQEGRNQIGRIKLQNTLAIMKTFLETEFKNIIVDGLVWSQAELDAVVKACGSSKTHRVFLFWLKTSKVVRHKRAIARGQDEADTQKFLDEVEKEIPDPTPFSLPSGHYQEIETNNKVPEEVMEELLRFMDINS